MKILVSVKRAVDHNVKVRIKSDKTGVDTENVKMSVKPIDEIVVAKLKTEAKVLYKETADMTSLVIAEHDKAAVVEPGSKTAFVGSEISRDDRPELTEAKIIVSGGRGPGSQEKFMEVMTSLADKLGATVGVSRAAVTAGYAFNGWWVGQIGKIAAPQLYIAADVLGAIQHRAGIEDSRTIVTINKDAEIPILSMADYGLESNLLVAVPELVTAL